MRKKQSQAAGLSPSRDQCLSSKIGGRQTRDRGTRVTQEAQIQAAGRRMPCPPCLVKKKKKKRKCCDRVYVSLGKLACSRINMTTVIRARLSDLMTRRRTNTYQLKLPHDPRFCKSQTLEARCHPVSFSEARRQARLGQAKSANSGFSFSGVHRSVDEAVTRVRPCWRHIRPNETDAMMC